MWPFFLPISSLSLIVDPSLTITCWPAFCTPASSQAAEPNNKEWAAMWILLISRLADTLYAYYLLVHTYTPSHGMSQKRGKQWHQCGRSGESGGCEGRNKEGRKINCWEEREIQRDPDQSRSAWLADQEDQLPFPHHSISICVDYWGNITLRVNQSPHYVLDC